MGRLSQFWTDHGYPSLDFTVEAKPSCFARRRTMDQKKCAHEPCACDVAAGEKFCSDWCKEAGSEEVEIACECGHEPCS